MAENFAELVPQFASNAWRVGELTLFEVLTGGAFDRLNWQHSGEFDQNASQKSNARGFARGGMSGFGIDRYISKPFNTIEGHISSYFRQEIILLEHDT